MGNTWARRVEMLPHRKLRGVVAYTSQTFPKTTPEASFSFNNVKKWTSVAGYAVDKIPGLAGEMPSRIEK